MKTVLYITEFVEIDTDDWAEKVKESKKEFKVSIDEVYSKLVEIEEARQRDKENHEVQLVAVKTEARWEKHILLDLMKTVARGSFS